MIANSFYKHVSGWIRSYRTPDMLEGLRRFIDNSQQPQEIKDQLYKELDYKNRILTQKPVFIVRLGKKYLKGEHSEPKAYISRFTAVCKLAELTLKGYECELEHKAGQYFITAKQAEPQP